MTTMNDSFEGAHPVYASVCRALIASGAAMGERGATSGRMGARAGRAGFIVDRRVDFAAGSVRRFVVDHQGPGRDAAMASYAAALTAAGVAFEIKAISPEKPTNILWIA